MYMYGLCNVFGGEGLCVSKNPESYMYVIWRSLVLLLGPPMADRFVVRFQTKQGPTICTMESVWVLVWDIVQWYCFIDGSASSVVVILQTLIPTISF